MLLWVLVGLICISILAFLVAVFNGFKTRELQARLQKGWGNLEHTLNRREDYLESLKTSFLLLKNHYAYDYYLDDHSWNNLDLDDVFGQINNTQSSLGAEYLYSRMRLLNLSDENKFENIKKYFRENTQERKKVQVILAHLGKKNHNQAFQIVFTSGLNQVKYYKLYLILGLLPLLSLILAAFSNLIGSFLFIGSISFNIVFYVIRKYSLDFELERMSYLVQAIHSAKRLTKFNFPGSHRLDQDLTKFRLLRFLSYTFTYKTGVTETSLIFEYLNAIFMIPFIAYTQLSHKLKKYDLAIRNILDTLANLDAAIANLSYLDYCDYYCIPAISNKGGLTGKEMYHPLIENPVGNSIDFLENTIISGDNASGKSTFMRVVAINCIVAQSLNFAFASTFSLTAGGILTSMNVEDSLLNGESHFVAESKRVQAIIRELSEDKFYYLFFDEVFNGTNSAERVSIAVSLMKWLATRSCLYMVTSHDTNLIKAGLDFNKNYYFTSDTDLKCSLRYKLKSGVSKTSNAISTLEKLGYPKEITQEAKQKLVELQENPTSNSSSI